MSAVLHDALADVIRAHGGFIDEETSDLLTLTALRVEEHPTSELSAPSPAPTVLTGLEPAHVRATLDALRAWHHDLTEGQTYIAPWDLPGAAATTADAYLAATGTALALLEAAAAQTQAAARLVGDFDRHVYVFEAIARRDQTYCDMGSLSEAMREADDGYAVGQEIAHVITPVADPTALLRELGNDGTFFDDAPDT